MISEYKIHHYGCLVKDIGKSLAYFCDRFGYLVESDVIEVSVQTAFVQFLRLPESFAWLELVCPTGEESKLSRALRKGVTYHHLCYEVDDIQASEAHLRENGMLSLATPAPAVAFGGRRIAWLMDRQGFLVELLEKGDGPFSLAALLKDKQHG